MIVKSMVQVRADEVMSELLGQVKGRVEVIDERGTVLGYFDRATTEDDRSYLEAAQQFDPGLIQRRKLEVGPGYSTSEVQEKLRSQGNP